MAPTSTATASIAPPSRSDRAIGSGSPTWSWYTNDDADRPRPDRNRFDLRYRAPALEQPGHVRRGPRALGRALDHGGRRHGRARGRRDREPRGGGDGVFG